ncbi:MAG: hypothetical protein ABFS34_13555 [Gemmatimonadota bacterium]
MGRTWIPAATALTLLLGASQPAVAQEEAPAPVDPDGHGPVGQGCSAEGYRAFDFWLGDWQVTNPAGAVAGTNSITRISNGCAMLEHWIGGGGTPGQSLNHFDPASNTWHQRWVGGNGLILNLAGELEDGAMVLSGERQGQNGPVIDKVTWTPADDGSVEQKWQVSQDGGETWNQVFLGTYKKAD